MPLPSVNPELLAELNQVLNEHPKNELRLAKLERAGKAMLSAGGESQIRGYLFLGACAAARGDGEASNKFHQATLKLSPADAQLWCNYLVSLTVLWDTSKAREIAFDIGDRFGTNEYVARSTRNSLVELGLLKSAADFYRKYEDGDRNETWVDSVDPVLEHYEIDEDQISQAVRIARDVLCERGFPRPEFSCDVIDSDSGSVGSLTYGFHPADVTGSLAEVQKSLFEVLAEKALAAEESGAVTFYMSPAWKEASRGVVINGNESR